MSKRQRRRVNKRRTIHMEQVKHRAGLVPRLSIAVAAVAVPAIAPPAAQAAPRAHHFEGSALRAVGFDVLKAPTGRAHRAHRLSDASFTGLAVTGAAAAPAPAPASAPMSAAAGAAIAAAPPPAAPAPAVPGQSAPTPSTTSPTTALTNPQAINPDAPPMVANPTPTTNAGTGGFSVGASYYDGIGGGATLVFTPQGAYIVPEFGIGFGPSVSAAAGSNVNVPNAPQLQLGFTGGDSIGPVGYRGSGSITVPLNDPSNPNVGGNFGFNVPGVAQNIPFTSVPLTNARVGFNYSPNGGLTDGGQYSATNQLFNTSDQLKLALRVPIPLPDLTQTTPPDANGVSDVITPTDAEGPPAISATRNVSNLGYPDGLGDTVTLNPDGSYTVHTSTADLTTFGPNYLNQQGLDSSQGGTLTHQLIDSLGQRTDQYTWQGNDGSQITQSPSGTLIQTNADGRHNPATRLGRGHADQPRRQQRQL